MTAPRKRRVFPFTAVIGQEEMKLALLLNVIDPRIGGVMIMGDRGTGKSTTIRALADLLPDIDVVAGDPYNSSASDPDLQSNEVSDRIVQGESLSTELRQVPMVDLPLGATGIACAEPLISRKHSVKEYGRLNLAFWPRPTADSFMSTKSISSMITWSTCCSTRQHQVGTPLKGKACPFVTRRGLF